MNLRDAREATAKMNFLDQFEDATKALRDFENFSNQPLLPEAFRSEAERHLALARRAQAHAKNQLADSLRSLLFLTEDGTSPGEKLEEIKRKIGI